MHSLDDVSAVVEDPADVFRVHCTCEMGVTVVTAVSAFYTDPLQKEFQGISNDYNHFLMINHILFVVKIHLRNINIYLTLIRF